MRRETIYRTRANIDNQNEKVDTVPVNGEVYEGNLSLVMAMLRRF